MRVELCNRLALQNRIESTFCQQWQPDNKQKFIFQFILLSHSQLWHAKVFVIVSLTLCWAKIKTELNKKTSDSYMYRLSKRRSIWVLVDARPFLVITNYITLILYTVTWIVLMLPLSDKDVYWTWSHGISGLF